MAIQLSNLNKKIGAIDSIVKQYTYPLYIYELSGVPELIGSCIFLEVEQKNFLVTAAHCIRNKTTGIFTAGDRGLVAVSGAAIATEGDKNDHFDIGAILIAEEFIDEQKINTIPETLHCDHYEVKNPQVRVISGYPCSKNKQFRPKVLQSGSLNSYCFTYAGSAQTNVNFKKFGMSETDHVCLRHEISRNEENIKVNPPSPVGMSGGPCWLVPDIDKPDKTLLEGINIEFKLKKYVFATKIGAVKQFVAREHKGTVGTLLTNSTKTMTTG